MKELQVSKTILWKIIVTLGEINYTVLSFLLKHLKTKMPPPGDNTVTKHQRTNSNLQIFNLYQRIWQKVSWAVRCKARPRPVKYCTQLV
jgi:hypothetical protein